ncbi:MAG TPA: amidase domain-containing protein [Pyrinomonadaceae bacterium]|jgi:hypothetical protein
MKLKNGKAILPLLVLMLTSNPAFGQRAAKPPDDAYVSKQLESQLLAIADEAVTTQLQILVSGDLDGSLKNKKLARLYRVAMMDRFKFQVYTGSKLKETRQDYKDFKTRLEVKAASKRGNKVTLKITETTELKLDVPGGPPFYAYVDTHLFDFVYEGNEWSLVKDTIFQPKPSAINTAEKLSPAQLQMIPLKDAPPGYRPGKMQASLAANSGAFLVKASLAPAAWPIGFNRTAAVDYATAHALSPNPAYYTFSNDCTNFVSQCMYTGGWQMVGFGAGFGRADPNNWYYSCISSFGQPVASYSWGGAYNFNVFILNAGRVDGVPYYTDLQPGDIIACDWDTLNGPHQPDGRIDHWVIITGKDTDGNVYVSYHSNNRLNKPMTQLRLVDEPGANFYGDRIR